MKIIELKECEECPRWIDCIHSKAPREFATGRSFPKRCPLSDHPDWKPPNQEVANVCTCGNPIRRITGDIKVTNRCMCGGLIMGHR